MLMSIILFDLEGTLVQTIEDDEETIREFRASTRRKLTELGVPPSELKGLVGATLIRNRALDYVREHFSTEDVRRFKAEMDRFMKDYEMRWAEESTVFPDTLLALRKLRNLGYRMGIVTNTSKDAALRELSKHGLQGFFDVVVTREDVERLKPDPGGVKLALKKLRTKKFFFVGDLIHDKKAAEKAGGTTIIINRNSSRNLEFNTGYVVRSLLEVPELLQTIVGDNSAS
jgi:HAD superfamily hydrolase (TIGR01549 family)